MRAVPLARYSILQLYTSTRLFVVNYMQPRIATLYSSALGISVMCNATLSLSE